MATIKVCGITNIEDAFVCGECEADFIGINFCHQSPRYVDTDKAEELVKGVKEKFTKIKVAGIFQNEQKKVLKQVCEKTGIDIIQLHGDEDRSYQLEIKKETGKEVIKAIRLKDELSFEYPDGIPADYILLDSFHPIKYGGTGITLNKKLAMKAMNVFSGKRIFFAGGINQSNIKDCLALRPFGVDINSGVEINIGRKDSNKIRDIVRIVKGGLR